MVVPDRKKPSSNPPAKVERRLKLENGLSGCARAGLTIIAPLRKTRPRIVATPIRMFPNRFIVLLLSFCEIRYDTPSMPRSVHRLLTGGGSSKPEFQFGLLQQRTHIEQIGARRTSFGSCSRRPGSALCGRCGNPGLALNETKLCSVLSRS